MTFADEKGLSFQFVFNVVVDSHQNTIASQSNNEQICLTREFDHEMTPVAKKASYGVNDNFDIDVVCVLHK